MSNKLIGAHGSSKHIRTVFIKIAEACSKICTCMAMHVRSHSIHRDNQTHALETFSIKVPQVIKTHQTVIIIVE